MGTADRRRRWLLLAGAAIGVVAVVWVVLVAWQLRAARGDIAAARDQLVTVRAGVTPGSLEGAGTERAVRSAAASFDRAHGHLNSGVLWPIRSLPLLGRQVNASASAAANSATVSRVVSTSLHEYRVTAARPHRTGPDRVRRLEDLASLCNRAQARLDRIPSASTTGLLGPGGRFVRRANADRVDLSAALGRIGRSAHDLARVMDGPSRYLVLGANNAEMRAGSGMFLSAGPLTLSHGHVALGPVRPTAGLVLPEGAVAATGDLAANWPWLHPGRDLRNAGLTADFPQAARLAARTWAAVPGGGPVQGVVAVDVEGLRALLRAVGPVTVGGVRYDADTVRGELLRRQYRRFGSDRAARRDRIGEVARAVFARVERGHWSLGDLGDALVAASRGRHLLVWTSDSPRARTFDRLGVSGRLDATTVSVDLLNRGGEKLDSYLTTAAHLALTPRTDGRTALTIRYVITNEAPVTGPRYVLGPNAAGLRAGEHRGIMLINLPAGASSLRWSGGPQLLVGSDGPTSALAGEIQVPRGTKVTVTVRALLPASIRRIELEPSARIPATTWVVGVHRYPHERRRTIELPVA